MLRVKEEENRSSTAYYLIYVRLIFIVKKVKSMTRSLRTLEKDRKIIEEVKTRPVLWQKSHQDHKNKFILSHQWQLAAKQFNYKSSKYN